MHVQQWFNLFSDYYNKEIVSQLYRAIKSNLLFKQVTVFIRLCKVKEKDIASIIVYYI